MPTTLGSVQVTVNGTPAPLFYVTPGQIAFLVPQMVSPFYNIFNATIQVINNNVKSNAVTVYTSLTAPGVFTQGGNGISAALAQHASGSFPLVTTLNPVKIGENVVIYATGLGSVTPAVADGAGGGSNPLSTINDTSDEVDFGLTKAGLGFAGLVPGFAGFYQLNTTVATGTASGVQFVNLSTPDGVTSEATIAIAGASITASDKNAPAAVRPHPMVNGRLRAMPQGLGNRAR